MCAFLAVIGVTILSGCSRQPSAEYVSHPLVNKYVILNTNLVRYAVLQRDSRGVYATYYAPGKTPTEIVLTEQHANYVPGTPLEIHRPELNSFLRECHIMVSNAMVASDIYSLVDVIDCHPKSLPTDYVVESAEQTDHAWLVTASFFGCVDDAHRRPAKYTRLLQLDDSGVLTNIVEMMYPRPMDMKEQNKATQATSQ